MVREEGEGGGGEGGRGGRGGGGEEGEKAPDLLFRKIWVVEDPPLWKSTEEIRVKTNIK